MGVLHVQSKNGSFQNQEEQASTSGLPLRRSASHQVSATSSCDCQQCIEGARDLIISCSYMYARHPVADPGIGRGGGTGEGVAMGGAK